MPRIDVVTLPMKSGTFLGISVLSHDGGIFVSDIIKGCTIDFPAIFFTLIFYIIISSFMEFDIIIFVKILGGAVALDGRIEVGDQIIQVNRSSFENLTDLQAVQLLRQAAASKKYLLLFSHCIINKFKII